MNYYDILKIKKNASKNEIKSSYKTLVKKYHPDLYVGDKDFAEQKIKEINEAYNILSNPETKAEYDSYLNASQAPQTSYSSVSQTYSNTNYTQNSTTNSPNEWGFTKFISEKIFKLDTKHQVQLFIIILIVILALFLTNLIQVKQYLLSPSENTKENTDTSITQEDTNIINNEFETNDIIPYDEKIYNYDFNSIDSILFDLFEQYEESLNNSTNMFDTYY